MGHDTRNRLNDNVGFSVNRAHIVDFEYGGLPPKWAVPILLQDNFVKWLYEHTFKINNYKAKWRNVGRKENWVNFDRWISIQEETRKWLYVAMIFFSNFIRLKVQLLEEIIRYTSKKWDTKFKLGWLHLKKKEKKKKNESICWADEISYIVTHCHKVGVSHH